MQQTLDYSFLCGNCKRLFEERNRRILAPIKQEDIPELTDEDHLSEDDEIPGPDPFKVSEQDIRELEEELGSMV